ncbi:unnamed protein product [Lasius platythorax]|uniref:Secreted protein n=1 Tax=Lasius platythorax TaxID=488582 RepID=A0AAV2PBZ9_9HYME
MFWTVVVLEFLRYAWIRTTGLFIYGSQERRATMTVGEPNYERSFRSMTDTLRDRPRARLNVNSRHFRDIAFS